MPRRASRLVFPSTRVEACQPGRTAGLLKLSKGIVKADLEILHAKLCSKQEWRPNEPAQKLMRLSTFNEALIEVARRAFPDLSGAECLDALLAHIAEYEEDAQD